MLPPLIPEALGETVEGKEACDHRSGCSEEVGVGVEVAADDTIAMLS